MQVANAYNLGAKVVPVEVLQRPSKQVLLKAAQLPKQLKKISMGQKVKTKVPTF